jgi:hypothetical protein
VHSPGWLIVCLSCDARPSFAPQSC